RIGSVLGRPCRPGTKSPTSASSSPPIRRSRRGSIGPRSRPSSIWQRPSNTSTSSSSACTRSHTEGRPFMSEAATHLGSGKVRELYAFDDDKLLLVASDRISTFDVVLPTEIPDKGRVLTGLSAFWFAQTGTLVPNHLLALRAD